jgi:hypothetical protein
MMGYIETIIGKGTITAGSGEQPVVDYQLHVLQNEVLAGPDSLPILALKEIRGVKPLESSPT